MSGIASITVNRFKKNIRASHSAAYEANDARNKMY